MRLNTIVNKALERMGDRRKDYNRDVDKILRAPTYDMMGRDVRFLHTGVWLIEKLGALLAIGILCFWIWKLLGAK